MNMKTFLFLAVSICIHFYSFSCSCIGESTVKNAYKTANLVVVGKVVSVKTVKIWYDTTYVKWEYNPEVDTVSLEEYKFNEEMYGRHVMEFTVVVEQAYKGTKTNDTIQIRTGFGNGDCGINFNLGKNYLIYAWNDYQTIYDKIGLPKSRKKRLKGVFETNICSRTAFYEENLEDLNYLSNKK